MIASKKWARGCGIPLYSSPSGCEIGNFCRLLSAAARIIVGMNQTYSVISRSCASLTMCTGGLYRRVPHDRH
jgi:hypothetical protein